MKISSKNRAGFEDGPEEGEIISDDLEDISDVSLSLTPRKSGKSYYHSDNLVGLSLSSVSESEENTLKVKNRRKRKKSYGHRAGRQKKVRRKPPDSDSSDEDSLETCRLKLQLKATVQLDSNDTHKNSLKNRLRAMVKTTDLDSDTSNKDPFSRTSTDIDSASGPPITVIDLVDHDTSSCVESIPENIDNSSSSSNDDIDNELIHLRLEALKTAIQNKYPNGVKSRKVIQDDTNKENSSNNSEKRPEVEMPQVSSNTTNSNSEHKSTTSPEEDDDVDVLRALLLASMARKITEIDSGPKILTKPKPHQNNSDSMISNNMGHRFKINNNVKNIFNNIQKCVSKDVEPVKHLTTPPVKPLIICVNSDSDSEWEVSSGSPDKSPKKGQNVPQADVAVQNNLVDCTVNKVEAAIESTIDKFLKEQREKVEHISPRNPETIIVNVPQKTTVTTTASNTKVNVAKPKARTPITALSKTKITANSQQLKKITFGSKITPAKAKIPKNLELEKSALKFLPANKREEYRKLQALLKEKKAQIITTRGNKSEKGSANVATAQVAGKFSQKPLPVRKIPIQTAKIKENSKTQPKCGIASQTSKLSNVQSAATQAETNERISDESTQTENLENVQLAPKTEARLKELRSQELLAEKRDKEKKQHTQRMRNILKQLQIKRNGRLQMEDKYKCLRPLIKELNGVNKEQKDCDQEIDKLLNQVTEIRKKQEGLHKKMMKSIKQLADKKAKIDLSITTNISQSSLRNVITSTPIKLSTTNPSTTCNTMSELRQDITMTGKDNPELYLDTKEQDNLAKDLKFMDTKEYIIDPNDIDQVIKKTQEQVAVLERKNSFDRRKPEKNKYISPLDSGSRQDDLDPFAIVCPFEVNGTCKDPDCSFNHLPK